MLNAEWLFRHRIVAATAPRMAAANPLRRQCATGHRAMFAHRVQRKLRTRRREPAAATGPEQKRLRR